ncbi:MAG TPA: hypothetical protein VH352_21405, partial [Pseudonocardiaceae bacterium]|nr:hypothetical protein [Pseudonocardiaceae bacterium]
MSITDGQVPTTRTVEFSGARPATEVLTWGQRAIWTAIGRISPEDAYFNFTKTLPLDGESVDMDQVLAAIGTVVERHEALCTRMTIVDGEPRQHVNERGTLKVEIIEAPEDGVGDMVAATTSSTPPSGASMISTFSVPRSLTCWRGSPSTMAIRVRSASCRSTTMPIAARTLSMSTDSPSRGNVFVKLKYASSGLIRPIAVQIA